MSLTVIKETGAGLADANSYASVADGDAYFEGHLYATAWTGATSDTKAAALVMATRLIDAQYQFLGYRANESQALQWPRTECPDPDRGGRTWTVLGPVVSNCVPYDSVPEAVVQATCELGRELIIEDRTAAPPGEGLATVINGSVTTRYSKSDTRPIISHVAQAMLAKYGALIGGGGGSVRLIRA
jgi:hypothetical protein